MGWFGKSVTVKAGTQLPDFVLPVLSGGETSSAELVARGPAVLAFFKVSCPVCQMTFPYLERLYRAGLPVFGVSQDKAGPTGTFVKEFGITFPILLDDPSKYAVSNAFGLTTVPTIVAVDPDSRISAVTAGFVKRDLEQLGERVGSSPFTPGERVPEFRPG